MIKSMVIPTMLCLLVTAAIGADVTNPFESYHRQIAKLEKELEKAGEKQKPRYEKKLQEVKAKLDAAVTKKKKPYQDKIERYRKSMAKTKRDQNIKKYEEKISELEKKISEIDKWGAGLEEETTDAKPNNGG